MKSIGFFREMGLYTDNGEIKDFLCDSVNYNKENVISYLKSQKRVAGCPRCAIDCVTGEEIAPSFSICTDGVYEWCDFLCYHIEQYNINLPNEFVSHIEQMQNKTR